MSIFCLTFLHFAARDKGLWWPPRPPGLWGFVLLLQPRVAGPAVTKPLFDYEEEGGIGPSRVSMASSSGRWSRQSTQALGVLLPKLPLTRQAGIIMCPRERQTQQDA